jgi:hypothetical protein
MICVSTGCLGILDGEILSSLDHLGQIFQRHIGAGARIVEPSVGVFFYNHRVVFCGHPHSSQEGRSLRKQPVTIAPKTGYAQKRHKSKRFVQCKSSCCSHAAASGAACGLPAARCKAAGRQFDLTQLVERARKA